MHSVPIRETSTVFRMGSVSIPYLVLWIGFDEQKIPLDHDLELSSLSFEMLENFYPLLRFVCTVDRTAIFNHHQGNFCQNNHLKRYQISPTVHIDDCPVWNEIHRFLYFAQTCFLTICFTCRLWKAPPDSHANTLELQLPPTFKDQQGRQEVSWRNIRHLGLSCAFQLCKTRMIRWHIQRPTPLYTYYNFTNGAVCNRTDVHTVRFQIARLVELYYAV